VSFRRRAGAPRLIDWTGERCVPWAPDVPVVYEHFHRYLWAAELLSGRRVLDLGSGEGFGAAILAESAEHVIGLEIDELTVEHSRLNYAGPNLEFDLGTALDLSSYEDGSFGAVVAFEIIEHVREQEQVLDGLSRLLGEEGILIISTPDRRMYGQARGEPNPFHERELSLEEFLGLLGGHFAHLASWGQHTITGSHLNVLEKLPDHGSHSPASEFFLERAGEEWRLAAPPAALYCVALASNSPLPAVAASSTLSDVELQLLRVKERELITVANDAEERSAQLEKEAQARSQGFQQERAEHARAVRDFERHAFEQRGQHDQDMRLLQEDLARNQHAVAHGERTIDELRERDSSLQAELLAARQALRRTEESVSWRAFQKVRSRLYGALGGERSLPARALGASLRLAGRWLGMRGGVSPSAAEVAPEAEALAEMAALEVIQMPEHERPLVSLVVPLHAHAELTRACLHSIRNHTQRVRYEVIVVEDAADAATRRLLEGVRGAKILHNDENIGYLRSMNRGASVARGDWLVLFNNDTEVTSGWLEAMLDCACSAPDVGVVTPKFIYPDGSLNEAGGIIWSDGTGVNYGRGDSAARFQYEYRRETDYGSAAALMVRSELWREVGGFDERYLPMYYEDADLCFEARERGLRVLYEPEAVVIHIEGATAGNDAESGHKRHQEQNRPKFVAKWRHRLESEQRHPASANVRIAANRHRGKHVLVVDHRVPMWDRDAGSLRILEIMQTLISLGARVSFMADNLAQLQPYTRGLQRLGIEVLYGEFDVSAQLAAIGPGLSTVILCRPHPTSHWLDTLREHAPSATIAYDTVDLHWLREARRGALGAASGRVADTGDGPPDPSSISPKAKALRELELAMIRATDVTVVVSDSERVQVQRDVPGANVLVVPTVHQVQSYVPPPDSRAGILFVGSFEHVPNVDAAATLVRDVMPSVWRAIGNVQVTIVGSRPPSAVEALASPLVEVAGWVEDLQPLLERSRLMVAPLRFGAGVKGKVTQCMAAGLPVVTSTLGAEGLDVRDGEGLLVADDPDEIAERVIRAYRDDELWSRLSAAGQSVVAAACTPEVIELQMRRLLGEDAAVVALEGALAAGFTDAR
jgi:GT2 family glycosyltransferase/SAM-dependent methyltransferase